MPPAEKNKQFWERNELAIKKFGKSKIRPQEREACFMFLELARERNKNDEFAFVQHPMQSQIEEWVFDQTILTNGAQALEKTKCILVDELKYFDSMLEDLLLYEEIAIDGEMSLHHQGYHGTYLCVLQISTSETDYIIDVLKMAGEMFRLKQILQNPTILKIFHGGDNDILALQADYKLFVIGLLDMQIVYKRLFNAEKPKFEKIVQKFLNETLEVDKSAQCADWTLRPLPTKMLRYARDDSRLLLKCWFAAKPLVNQKVQENSAWMDIVVQDCKKTSLLLKTFKPQKYVQSCVEACKAEMREAAMNIAKNIVSSARKCDKRPGEILSPRQLTKMLSTKDLTCIIANAFIAVEDKEAIQKCMVVFSRPNTEIEKSKIAENSMELDAISEDENWEQEGNVQEKSVDPEQVDDEIQLVLDADDFLPLPEHEKTLCYKCYDYGHCGSKCPYRYAKDRQDEAVKQKIKTNKEARKQEMPDLFIMERKRKTLNYRANRSSKLRKH